MRTARIEFDYVSIDTTAWLEQRTGGVLPDLTDDLHTWATTHQPSSAEEANAADRGLCWWQDAVLRWCHTRGHVSPDRSDQQAGPMVITHTWTRLDVEVWIARTRTPDHGLVAVVQRNDQPPLVYADTAETADWYDPDSVEICCPGGHGWTWRTGHEVIDADGSGTTLAAVFGTDADAPFTPCQACIASRDGRRGTPCGCDGSAWIVCPTCGARCDVHLPTR
jgi:hypothetical protein